MRIALRATLLLCLFLWIPAALSQSTSLSVDDEASGDTDTEFSGSGSGDDGSVVDFKPTEVTTQPTTNMTQTIWVTEAPVKLPVPTVTQLSSTSKPQAEVELTVPSTKAPLPSTTKIPETQPSPTSVKSLINVEDILKVENATIQHVNQENTTTPLDGNVPVVPVTTEQPETSTEPEIIQEETTFTTTSVVLDEEDTGTPVPDVGDDQTTDASDVESTTLPPTTASANEVAEPETTEASGDLLETTTVQAIVEDSIDTNVIPGVNHEPEVPNPDDGDFEFADVPPKTRANVPKSKVSLGASSDDGSLLERTEVLAGVIAGGLVGLAFAILLVALMVYRMKKKDEGSYSLDEHKHPNGGYQKPVAQEEFLA